MSGGEIAAVTQKNEKKVDRALHLHVAVSML
jgi:hypothetical protein